MRDAAKSSSSAIITTDIPARLDALPFGRFHLLAFPLEIRALAIAFFYAIGTGIGGIAGPLLVGMLISTGSRLSVAVGYMIGAILMTAAAVVQARWGIAAERKSLEAGSRPLAFID